MKHNILNEISFVVYVLAPYISYMDPKKRAI